jgi:WD40 repeat protein
MENIKTFDDINMLCKIHNSPVGGVCSDHYCQGSPLLCIFCAIDENSCVRKFNHQIITFEEYFNKYEKEIKSKIEGKNISHDACLNYLCSMDFENFKSDYSKKLQKIQNEHCENNGNLKEKFKKCFIEEVDGKNKQNSQIVNGLQKTEKDIADLKNIGFDLILGENIFERFEKLKTRYSEFRQLDKTINDMPSDIITENASHNTISDFSFTNKFIHLIKTLLSEQKLNEKLDLIFKQKGYINNLNSDKEMEASLHDFESYLYGLDFTLPKVFGGFMNGLNNNANIDLLKRYMNKNSKEVFSYLDCELYNTSKKQGFCNNDPKTLKYSLTLSTSFQTKNTLPEMVCIFKTNDENKYIAYSNDVGKIHMINYTQGFKENMPNKIIDTNKGSVYKMEHYFSASELKDYIITVTAEKKLFLFTYNPDTQSLDLLQTMTFPFICYSFEIIELNGRPYIIVSLQKSFVTLYNLNDLTVYKTTDVKLLTFTYSLKAFYNKVLKQYILLLMTNDSIVIMNIETGLKLSTLVNTNKKNWFLHAIAVEVTKEDGGDSEYHIVANMQNDIGVFSFNTGKLLKVVGCKTTAYRGIEIWNENYVIGCNDSKDIDIYDLKTGLLVHNLKNHTRHICGCKRIKDSDEMLLSFSMDGTLVLYKSLELI